MGVTIKNPNFRLRVMDDLNERVRRVAYNTLSYVGEEAVKEARNNGSYQDQTGNLRSSISYVVTDGKNIGIDKGELYKSGSEGASKGKKLVQEYAARHKDDIELHIVAGMEYADYVERIHGKNVLSSARVLIDKEVPDRLRASGLTVKVKSK